MTSPRFLIAGRLHRDFIITPQGKILLDIPGGNLLYAATGAAIWESGIGLIGRIGEDFPQEWLEQLSRCGFDHRGIHIVPETLELRRFIVYSDFETAHLDNPVAHFAKLRMPIPKSLLGYAMPTSQPDHRTQPTPFTIRINEIPEDYLDATAAHLCPLDYLNHSLLPSSFHQRGHLTTITLDPSPGYMTPLFWDDIPAIVKGLTAFLCSETKLNCLFQGRSDSLWEMAEALAAYGCEIIVIKRGAAGQYLYNHANHSRWVIPAYPVNPVDPTGAGDAFCGGFLVGYRQSHDPLEAALHGNIAASLVIEGSTPFYALDALPGLAQARLENLRYSVRKA